MSARLFRLQSRNIKAQAEAIPDRTGQIIYYGECLILIKSYIEDIDLFIDIRDPAILTDDQYDLPEYLCGLKLSPHCYNDPELMITILAKERRILLSVVNKVSLYKQQAELKLTHNHIDNTVIIKTDNRVTCFCKEKLLKDIFWRLEEKKLISGCSGLFSHIKCIDSSNAYDEAEPMKWLGSDYMFSFLIHILVCIGILCGESTVKFAQFDGHIQNSRNKPFTDLSNKLSAIRRSLRTYIVIRMIIKEALEHQKPLTEEQQLWLNSQKNIR